MSNGAATALVQGGFAAIPRRTLDLLLCLPLTRRELSVLLLVARLTYGCRNAPWACLRQADLAAVGIGAGHARRTLDRLVSSGMLERRGILPEYRIGKALGDRDMKTSERAARLGRLVTAQLAGSSRNGNIAGLGLPKRGSQAFPKGELSPYRNGNASTVPAWHFDRSQGRFLRDTTTPIDKERHG